MAELRFAARQLGYRPRSLGRLTYASIAIARGAGSYSGQLIEYPTWRFLLEMLRAAMQDLGQDGHIKVELGFHRRTFDLKEEKFSLPARSQVGLVAISIRSAAITTIYTARKMLDNNLAFPDALVALAARHDSRASDALQECPAITVHGTFQFSIRPLLGGVSVDREFRGKPLVTSGEVTRSNTEACVGQMENWMFANVSEAGCLTYRYQPSRDVVKPNTNRIRDFMGTIALQVAARRSDEPRRTELADANLVYNIRNYYQEECEYAVINEGAKVKLGAVALAALATRGRIAADIPEDAEVRLSRLTHMLQATDGSFRTFLRPAHRDKDCQNFYPGETLLLWATQLESYRDAKLLARAIAAFEYYRTFHRERPNPAFVPWHTQAVLKLYRLTGREDMKDFVFEMSDWILALQQPTYELPAPDMDGRFYSADNDFGPPHASSTGVYMEGLGDAFRLAYQIGDYTRAERYAATIRRAVRNVLQLQFGSESELPAHASPKRTLGGIRTTEYDNEIRIDNVQHNYMALCKILADAHFPW
jgi:hypothetical protein